MKSARCRPVKKAAAVVSMYNYERPSWTGLVYPTECYFPTWKVEENHFTGPRPEQRL
ncbi:deacetylase YgeY [Klebsiella grimontii]|nr:deacetylase YgeY [Klebsiella grimontii]